jgi:methylenetetrahydrofolate dehydrogenase (NADP+)/methenyltetrahydrofolate cyclohydrolase
MSARILDGAQLASEKREQLKKKIEDLKQRGLVPGLAFVLVGDNPASASYIRAKGKTCAQIGINSIDRRLPENADMHDVRAVVEELNTDDTVHGILVQLPLPGQLDEQTILQAVAPEKDVDGFHPLNLGKMMLGLESVLPCTPYGIVEMLKTAAIQIEGSHTVIVGRSNIVGKPLANMLVQKHPDANATVTVCHSRTRDLKKLTLQADILVAAAGQYSLITADMVREGAVVIDVAMNRVPDDTKKRGYRLCGDVDFDAVKEKASYITPVPGGVGPMTITMLMENTVKAALRINGRGDE